jgi:hypothetical protein
LPPVPSIFIKGVGSSDGFGPPVPVPVPVPVEGLGLGDLEPVPVEGLGLGDLEPVPVEGLGLGDLEPVPVDGLGLGLVDPESAVGLGEVAGHPNLNQSQCFHRTRPPATNNNKTIKPINAIKIIFPLLLLGWCVFTFVFVIINS